MHPDMKRMYHKAIWFPSARAFDETAHNLQVYKQCAASLVKATSRGGVATLFMFGQTGSGKVTMAIALAIALALRHPTAPPRPRHPCRPSPSNSDRPIHQTHTMSGIEESGKGRGCFAACMRQVRTTSQLSSKEAFHFL